eukprot:CAMPEP_0171734888 /NCGR_PEP_ID=MMETSP0991-20121206/31231_1 /TAXON_ID=483369 /ORGANISM="non described non described, Strain CCMP2098" /LENGTH=240 /DNA_ID=CAMNT_0012331051 /DNA_START=447 /DNA_END=1166 /DNA_ORIENTATION=+
MNMRIFISILALAPVSVYVHAEECMNDNVVQDDGSCKPLAAVDLGEAAKYAVLAGSGITIGIGSSVVPGKIGISPGTAVIGFDNFDAASEAFAGKAGLYTAYEEAAAAYVGPADRTLVAYVDGQAKVYDSTAMYKPADFILSDKDMGGMTLKPGVYKFAVAAALNGRLVLDDSGEAPHVWIFQTGSTAIFAANSEVIFQTQMSGAVSNSAVDQVTWQVGSSATMNSGAKVIGNVLAYASI